MVEEVYVFESIEMIAFKAWFAAISLRWRRPPWRRGSGGGGGWSVFFLDEVTEIPITSSLYNNAVP
jgi:hypothetical protein